MNTLAMRRTAARPSTPEFTMRTHKDPISKRKPGGLKNGDIVVYRLRKEDGSWGPEERREFSEKTGANPRGPSRLGPDSPIRKAIMKMPRVGENTTFHCTSGKLHELRLVNIIDG